MLFHAERELVLETEKMRLEYGIALGDKSPSRLDAFIKTLEDDRDYYKQELEYLQKMVQRRSSPGRRASEKVIFPLSKSSEKVKQACSIQEAIKICLEYY